MYPSLSEAPTRAPCDSVQSPVQVVVSSWELEIKQVVCLVSLVKQVVCLALKCQMHRATGW